MMAAPHLGLSTDSDSLIIRYNTEHLPGIKMKTRQRKSAIMLGPVSTVEVINNLMKCEILHAIWSFSVAEQEFLSLE